MKIKSEFTRNVVTLMFGSGLSQIIVIVISPLLTRLYSPEDYGTASLFLSIASVLMIITTLRYEMAIIQTKKNIDAISLGIATLLISVSLLVVIEICLLILSGTFLLDDLNVKLGGLLFYIPLYTLIAITVKVLINYMNRNKFYKTISLNQVILSVFTSGSKLSLGVIKTPMNGLVLGTILGQLISSCLLFYSFFNLKIKKVIYVASFKRIKQNLTQYSNFPRYLLLSDGMNVIAIQLPYFFTSFLFSVEQLGFLALAYSISAAPLTFLGTSLSRVFRQQVAEEYNKKGRCDELFLKMLRKLVLYLTIPFIVIFFLSPILFEWIFGKQWIESGHIVQILIVMFFFQFFARILSYMYILTEHQKENLYLQLLLLISTISSFVIGFKIFNDFYISLLLFSLTYSIFYIYTVYKSYIYSKGY